MFRLWAKEYKKNRMIRDFTVCDDSDASRTSKVFNAVTSVCMEFDLSEPLWLDLNIKDFQRTCKTRFTSDNFIEALDFDYLEIQVIEED